MKQYFKYTFAFFLVMSGLISSPLAFAQIERDVEIFNRGDHADVKETRFPWQSKVEVTTIADGLPVTIKASQAYDYLIYTSSVFGPLEHMQSYAQPDAQIDLIQTPSIRLKTECPYADLQMNNANYEERYLIVEEYLRSAIRTFITKNPTKTKLAITSFYNPIYFPDFKLVAFYTLNAIDSILQQFKVERVIQITILSNGYPEIQLAFDEELKQRKQMTKEKKFYFKVETQVDRKAELHYYLKKWDLALSAKKLIGSNGIVLTKEALIRSILDSKNYLPPAPIHIAEEIRNTLKIVYPDGTTPNLDAVRARLHEIVEKRYQNAPDKQAKISDEMNRILSSIKDQRLGAFARVGIFAEILSEYSSFNKVWNTIKKAMVK